MFAHLQKEVTLQDQEAKIKRHLGTSTGNYRGRLLILGEKKGKNEVWIERNHYLSNQGEPQGLTGRKGRRGEGRSVSGLVAGKQ